VSDDLVNCEGHGQQHPAFACQHLAESQPDDQSIGFHWNCDDGDLIANCDACEAETDDEGFLTEDYVLENFVLICRLCFVEIAAVNGVENKMIEQAEAAAITSIH
jgi:hypothetical protein